MKIKQTIILAVLSIGLMSFLTTSLSFAAVVEKCPDGRDKPAIISCETDVNDLLLLVINILTAGIGVAAVAGVVYGSVLYTSASGNAEQVKKARSMITNVVIGIVAYALMYAFLNFIIPGGLFA